MIQRIQTVYLFIAFCLSVVTLCMPIGVAECVVDGFSHDESVYCFPVSGYTTWVQYVIFAVLLLVSTLSLFEIFCWKNRKTQMRLSLVIMFLGMSYLVFCGQMILLQSDDVSIVPTVWAALPLVSAVLNILAYIAIKKDDDLVRSLDRLR